MKKRLGIFWTQVNVKTLSAVATIALVISTMAVNQRCWYVMHEDVIPEECKKLRRF